MKILNFSWYWNLNCLGGVETFQRNLYRIFGKNIIFFGFKTKKKKYFNMENMLEMDLRKNSFTRLLKHIIGKDKYCFYFARNILKKENIKALILNSPINIGSFYELKCKKILVQHGSWDFYKTTIFTEQPELYEIIRDYIDCFVFLSKYDQEKFVRELNFDINKTKVIRHCCEVELLENKKEKNKRLIIIARLENETKRLDLAIRAMKKLPDFTLEIYGAGSDEKMFRELIKQEKLENNVFLKGVTNKIKEKLDECSMFIMTSDYEGYPITSIEAMRRGLPIVLRNTFDSAKDIIENNGILLDKEWNEDKFAEAVRKIYDNYEFYSKNAVEMGKRHDFEIIKSQWEELVKSI